MIKTRMKPDSDAFSPNQYKTLWTAKDGSEMKVNLLNGKQEYVKAKKKKR